MCFKKCKKQNNKMMNSASHNDDLSHLKANSNNSHHGGHSAEHPPPRSRDCKERGHANLSTGNFIKVEQSSSSQATTTSVKSPESSSHTPVMQRKAGGAQFTIKDGQMYQHHHTGIHRIKPLPQPLGTTLNGKRQSNPVNINRIAGDPRGFQQETTVTINSLEQRYSHGTTTSGMRSGNDFIPRNATASKLGGSRGTLNNGGTPQKVLTLDMNNNELTSDSSYPNLVVTNTPTKQIETWAGGLQLKDNIRGGGGKFENLQSAAHEVSNPIQKSQLLLNNNSAESYFPIEAEQPAGQSRRPPEYNSGFQVLHMTKRTAQVSQLIQSTTQHHKIVDAYNNLAKTIEMQQAANMDKSASSSSLSKAAATKMPPVPQSGRSGRVTSNNVGRHHMGNMSAARKPPFKVKEAFEPLGSSVLRQKQQVGYSVGPPISSTNNHWQLPNNQALRATDNTLLTANNRLATLKREQLQRGLLNQHVSNAANTIDQSSLPPPHLEGTPQHNPIVVSPMKIVQQLEDDDNKYLVLNNYHHQVENEGSLIQNFSQFPTTNNNAGLSQGIYLGSPNKSKPQPMVVANHDQYSNLMMREGSVVSIKGSTFYPTQTFDAGQTNRRSLDESHPITSQGISASAQKPHLTAQTYPFTNNFDQQAFLKKSFAAKNSPSLVLDQQKALKKAVIRRQVVQSGHFRHTSNSVKKAILAQVVNQQAPGNPPSTLNAPLLQVSPNTNRNALLGGSSLELPKEHEEPPQPFQYKVVPALSYESQSTNGPQKAESSSPPAKGTNPHHKKEPIKKFGKFNNMRASQGFDDINKELQTIIQKERILTDEIIKNSLVKQNGRFNFEALAHLNDIIESKKNLKKKFGVEGLSVGPKRQQAAVPPPDHCMVIKSYSESQNNEVYDKVLNTNVMPNESFNEFSQPSLISQYKDCTTKNKKIQEFFLKNAAQYKLVSPPEGTSNSMLETTSSPTNNAQQIDPNDPFRIYSVLNTRHTFSSSSTASAPPIPPTTQPILKIKKKKKSPREIVKKPAAGPKITIYHPEDASKRHLQEHPINKAIQKINYLIRLIFKYQNASSSKQDSTAPLPNATLSQGGANLLGGASQYNSATNNNQQAIQPTVLQAHQVEEQRLQEIQRVAAKWFGISLPLKKLESKAALREYFQSREFTVGLRQKMNQVLHAAVNRANRMTEIVNQLQAQQAASGQYFQRFFVGWGNNETIVRSVLKQRHWWQQGGSEDFGEVAFMWTQWKKQAHLDFLGGGKHPRDALDQSSFLVQQPPSEIAEALEAAALKRQPPRLNSLEQGIKLYNRMENNKQLTNKKGVFLNMREYYYLMGKDPFEVLPMTFLIKTGRGTGDTDFQRFALTYQDVAEQIRVADKQRALEVDRRLREIRFELQRQRREEQVRLERMQELAAVRKRSQQLLLNKKVPPVPKHPQMRGLPTKGGYFNTMVYEEEPEESDEEEEQLRRQEEERAAIESDERLKEIRRKYPVQRNIWIVKPGENTNRGNGISVCSELNEIRSLVLSSRDGAADSTFIIQRYIENPLLIHGRKFDFRCYGVLASVNGGLRGYFYEDAYIRTSCKEFDIEDVHNKFVHLTNDAVQKYSADYGKYENGNKLSLQDFQKYLRATYPLLGIEVWRDIMPQIRKLVTDSYRAVYGKIDPFRLHNSFELFGYDFMLDENFRLYLIEVNTNPCLEMSCPLLARIIPEVLDNTFRLVLDPIFPAPSGDQQHTRKYQLIPQEIKYSLVFDEEIDGPELKAAALREPKRPPSDPAQSNPLQGGAAGPIGVIDEIESDQEEDDKGGAGCIPQGEDSREGATNSQCSVRKNVDVK